MHICISVCLKMVKNAKQKNTFDESQMFPETSGV